MAAAQEEEEEEFNCRKCCCCCVIFLAVIAAIVFLGVFIGTSTGPVYSVTVDGVAGLDPAADLSSPRATLSPVFNLTVRIDNARERMSTECIGRLSTVAVSYGDALLGHASVPEFCAKEYKVQERGVRAWGESVVVPRFLRHQLAGQLAVGEAYVDVKVTTPADCHSCGDQVLICSKAKIGGGPATCGWTQNVYHPAAATTGTDYIY